MKFARKYYILKFNTIDLSTRLWGINVTNSVSSYSPEFNIYNIYSLEG